MVGPVIWSVKPLVAYLLGSVPFALLIGASQGVDLRKQGTGNIGAGNLTRAVGVGPGAAAAVLDGLKGLAPILLCRQLGVPSRSPCRPGWRP